MKDIPSNAITIPIPEQSAEADRAKELPIRSIIWENAPSDSVEISVRDRISEFFDSPETPPEIKALGILSEELFVVSAREAGEQNRQDAFNNQTQYVGESTIYAMALFEDRLNFAFSPVRDYPNHSLGIASISLEKLDSMTGQVAQGMAEEIPEIIETLTSSVGTNEQKNQAKVDLFRFLAKKKPEAILKIDQSFNPHIGLAFVPDGQRAVVRLLINEIPRTDPVSGEAMELYEAMTIYKNTEIMMDNEEFLKMTTEKIENYLNSLPEWIKKKLIGPFTDSGYKSWRIFQFFEQFGYKGNEYQQKFKKSEKMSMGFLDLSDYVRFKILEGIAKGVPPEENGLDKESIDLFFIENYEQRPGNKKLPNDFSVTDIIMNRVPIEDLKIG